MAMTHAKTGRSRKNLDSIARLPHLGFAAAGAAALPSCAFASP